MNRNKDKKKDIALNKDGRGKKGNGNGYILGGGERVDIITSEVVSF